MSTAHGVTKVGARVAWVVVDADADVRVGELLAELGALGFVACRATPTAIAQTPSAPDIVLVVASGPRAGADLRRTCAGLGGRALPDVPTVLVMPAGTRPIADPLLAAHELIFWPLRPGELRLRIVRASAAAPARPAIALALQLGPLRLDPFSDRAWIGDEPVPLTCREFALLHHLARDPGRVHSRAELRDAVWRGEGAVQRRAVDVLVRRVRSKLGDELGCCIRTVRSVGYAFNVVSSRALPLD